MSMFWVRQGIIMIYWRRYGLVDSVEGVRIFKKEEKKVNRFM